MNILLVSSFCVSTKTGVFIFRAVYCVVYVCVYL